MRTLLLQPQPCFGALSGIGSAVMKGCARTRRQSCGSCFKADKRQSRNQGSAWLRSRAGNGLRAGGISPCRNRKAVPAPMHDQQDEPKHAKAARACCGGRRRRWHDSIYNGGPADGQAAWAGPVQRPTAARALKTSGKAKKCRRSCAGWAIHGHAHRQRQRTQQAPVSERRAGPAAGIATSEVGGNAIFFPIPVTGGLGSAPPADLRALGSGGTAYPGFAASLLCFRQGALCLRRQGLGGLQGRWGLFLRHLQPCGVDRPGRSRCSSGRSSRIRLWPQHLAELWPETLADCQTLAKVWPSGERDTILAEAFGVRFAVCRGKERNATNEVSFPCP